MTVSEGLPLNSKYIKMSCEAMRGGGFSSRWSEMSVSIPSQAKSVSNSCQANII